MYTCNHCKKKFNNKPFICSNNKKYCCLKCTPDSEMNKPYAFQYFNLIESIQNIELSIMEIKYLYDRTNLEDELNDLQTTYIIDMWGENESLYYKRQIQKTILSFDDIYQDINNIFITRKTVLRSAVVIYWYDLQTIIGKKLTKFILDSFIEDIRLHYNGVFENVSPGAWPSYQIGEHIDRLCVNTLDNAIEIRRIFYKYLVTNKKLMTKKQRKQLSIESLCIRIKELCYCVNCGFWEDSEEFAINEELNIYQCSSC